MHRSPLHRGVNILLSILIILWLIPGCATVAPPREDTAPLTILHWNDFHAHNVPYEVAGTDSATGKQKKYTVGGSANLLGYLNHFGRGNKNVAVLFAGDDFQGPPVSGVTKGMSQIELMNIIHPDATTLGNHEFDYGVANLRQRMEHADYPILVANVFDSTRGATLAQPAMVKEFANVKVGLIGLLPPDLPILTAKSTLAGMRMLDVDSVLDVHIRRLKNNEKVDLIVLLSHMGVEQDTQLAARRKDVDIIVGGHSHTPLFKPIKKNRTIIVQAGSWGRYLGRLDCVVDLKGDSVKSFSGVLTETKVGTYPVDTVAEHAALSFESLVDKDLNEVIGYLAVDWETTYNTESNTGNWQADVTRSFAATDIALVNSGGLRKSMFIGPITKRDIWEMNPFGNTLVTFTISGEQVLQMLEWQASGKGELMQVSGFRYSFDPNRPAGSRIIQVAVAGSPVVPTRSYSVVTNNYVGGHARELLGLDNVTVTDLYVLDRDILIDYIQKHKTITSAVDGRITNIRLSTNNEERNE